MSGQSVGRELLLSAPVSEVWAALTRPDRLSAWFGARARLDLRLGGRATFTWPDGAVRDATIEGVQTERLLVLRWLPFERDATGRARQRPAGTVRFHLVADGAHTRLSVTETQASDDQAGLELYPPRYIDPLQSSPASGPPFNAKVGA